MEHQLSLALAPAQPDPDLGDPRRDRGERDRLDPHPQRVALGQIAQLRAVLGVQRRHARLDRVARELAPRFASAIRRHTDTITR